MVKAVEPGGRYADMLMGSRKLKVYFTQSSGFQYSDSKQGGGIACKIYPFDKVYIATIDDHFENASQEQRSITLLPHYFILTDIAGNNDLFLFGRSDPMSGIIVDFSNLKKYIEKIIDAESGEILYQKKNKQQTTNNGSTKENKMPEQGTTQITFVFRSHVRIKQTSHGDLLLVATNTKNMKNMFVITKGDRASHTDNSVTLKSGVVVNREKTNTSELVHFECKMGPNYLPKNWITEIRKE